MLIPHGRPKKNGIQIPRGNLDCPRDLPQQMRMKEVIPVQEKHPLATYPRQRPIPCRRDAPIGLVNRPKTHIRTHGGIHDFVQTIPAPIIDANALPTEFRLRQNRGQTLLKIRAHTVTGDND